MPEDFSISQVAADIEKIRKEREARNRTFELCGETFTHKPGVAMETLAAYFDMTSGANDVSNADAIDIIDSTVLAFLEPGQEAKWKKVRDPKLAHPITHGDAHALLEGLVRSLTGRPTGQPSDSTDGAESNGTKSTEDSPLLEAVPSKK